MPPIDPSGITRFILEQGVSALSASAGVLFELDSEAETLVPLDASACPKEACPAFARVPLDAPLPASEAARERELVLVEELAQLRERYPGVELAPGQSPAFACVPLLADETLLGVLVLSFARPRRFGAADLAAMRAIGHLGAHALIRAESEAAKARARARMSLLARVSHSLSESLDPELALRSLARLSVEELADECRVELLDEAGRRRAVAVAVAHEDPAELAPGEELDRPSPPLAAEAEHDPVLDTLQTGRSHHLREIPAELAACFATLEELGPRSALIVPARARGRTLAAIIFVSTGRLFVAEDLELAEELGRRIGVALDHARLRDEAEASQASLAGILASAMDAIITVDAEQRIVLFNDAAERMFGHTAAAMQGEPLTALIPERFRRAHVEHVRRFGGCSVHRQAMGSRGTLWGLRADGGEFPIEAVIVKLGERGQPRYAVILRDISERVASERRAEESARRKEQFLAMLGHELRNPLAAIRHAHELQGMTSAPPDSERALSWTIIDRQVRHMIRLIDDLLDVSRIARGKIELRVGPLDLARVARAVIADHESRARDAGVGLRARVPAEQAWVRGDEARLTQVLDNLLDNAIKFTDAGGEVQVSLRSAGGEHLVEVADTGIGLEPEHLRELFEPFHQADASLARTQGGLGLGLAVCRGIVELHGGEVEAASAGLHRGSVFTVKLPMGEAPSRTSQAGGQPASLPYRRIVVIEDNEDAALLLGLLLQRVGAEALVAHSGEAGLELIRHERPQLVLCDIGLPGALDGYQVAEAIRADRELAATPLVALSGYGLPEDVARARSAGFDAHLTKPVSLAALRDVLDDVAARRRAAASA